LKRFFLEMLDGSKGGKPKEVASSVTLGRSSDNDLVFIGENSGIVSARHALVALKSQTLWLRDLDSTNGTFVGKTKVTERELLGGEIISLGPSGPAMRVLVVDAPDPRQNETDIFLLSAQATTIMPQLDVGLLAKSPNRIAGNRSLILEMAKRLRRTHSPQEVMQGLLHDPERLARLLQGGIMPERVADWMGGLGHKFAKSRRRIFWIGGILGAFLLAAISVLGFQNLNYRAKIKKQGTLLSQIHDLETGLGSIKGTDSASSSEKVKLVRQLLDAERELFLIRDKLRIPDRAPTYRLPLGADVHMVLEELGKKGFIVPESFIESVQEQIEYFTAPANRGTLIRGFARKPMFEALIRQELDRAKLPMDFLYIAMQESLLDSMALSGNGARGLWQLVPETAREYGLQVPEAWEILPPEEDERTRPKLATRAAAKYLHLLFSEFGDAALTLAAYNAGGNKMRRVLRQIEDPVNDRDFWYLYRMGLMHEETSEFVPKIIAMILIDRNRSKYGFKEEVK
jgi:Transglycosylase SLT domain/FHA domain